MHLLGKSDASLGPRFRTSPGNFLAWHRSITRYWFYMWVAMEPQYPNPRVIQRDFSTLAWLVRQCGAHNFFLYPSSCWQQEETDGPTLILCLVSLPEFWFLEQWDGLQGTRLTAIRWDSPFSKGEEVLCSGASRAH